MPLKRNKRGGKEGNFVSLIATKSKDFGEVESFRLSRQPNFDDFNHEIFLSLPSDRIPLSFPLRLANY